MPKRAAQDEEIEALETTEPLVDAPPTGIRRVRPVLRRESYFTLRLSPSELDRLARVAARRRTKPGTLARNLIMEGPDRMEGGDPLEARTEALEREVGAPRGVGGGGPVTPGDPAPTHSG